MTVAISLISYTVYDLHLMGGILVVSSFMQGVLLDSCHDDEPQESSLGWLIVEPNRLSTSK